jgi:hypothetical protein
MCPSWDNLDQAIIGQVTQRFSHRIVRNAVLPGEVQVTTVADNRICNNVGTVESQSPPPGTVVVPGGYATIRVYVPPPGGCF